MPPPRPHPDPRPAPEVSRLNSGPLEMRREFCDVPELLEAAAQAVRERLPGIRINLDAPQDLPPCSFDIVLIDTALQSLLFHAAAHNPAGQPIHLAALLANGHLSLMVRDHGPGLPEGPEPERLFERFQRGASTPAGALGLGLTHVCQLVDAHSGRLTAQNAPAGGVWFVLTIPVATGKLLA